MNPRLSHLLLVLLPCAPAASLDAQALLVSSRFTNQVLLHDDQGRFVRVFASGGGLANPVGLAYGPDGALYVASANTNQVLRYDGVTGAFLGVFASGGGLAGPRNLTFGPDGHLYVCSGATSQVLQFDGVTGAFRRVFAQHATLSGPTSLCFGPDGSLWVGSVLGNRVVHCDGVTGAFIAALSDPHFNAPHDLGFGPDGALYVSNAFGGDNVLRLDGATGAFAVFVRDAGLINPLGLSWRPDGDLLVVNQGGDDVRRYDGATGAPRGAFIAPGSGGLDGPLFAVFARAAGQRFSVLPPIPPTAGQPAHFTLAAATPGALAVLLVGATAGTLPLPCPGQALDMLDPLILALGFGDESGYLVWRIDVPAGLGGAQIRLQGVDIGVCAASALLLHRF